MAAALLPFFEELQRTYLAETIGHSATLIALLEIIHLIGLTLLLGTVLMVDLTLLGHGIARQPVALVARELKRWTLAGLIILLASGPLIFISESVKCFHSPAFWIKMALLAMAILYYFTLHRAVVSAQPPVLPPQARWAAVLSLTLWTGVALAGKAIAILADLSPKQ
jgi:hypothetical protein